VCAAAADVCVSCQIAGIVPDSFDPKKYMDAKEVRRQARFTHFAVAASRMAIEDAKLDLKSVDLSRVGCMIGMSFLSSSWVVGYR